MISKSVVARAILSTQAYLQLLDDQRLGRSRHHLRPSRADCAEIQPVAGELRWVARFRGPRQLRLPIGGMAQFQGHQTGLYSDCLIVDYDPSSGDIQLGFPPENRAEEDGTLECDLRWLVRQQLHWLQERGSSIRSPFSSLCRSRTLQPADMLDLGGLPVSLSASQLVAVKGALGAPLAYVMGPPGSGKTSRVLAAVVLSLLRGGKRILLTGPTNIAVDNALLAILAQLPQPDHAMATRLGGPTPALASQYPHVCEDNALRLELSRLQKAVDRITVTIRSLEQIGKNVSELHKLTERIRSHCERYSRQEETVSHFRADLDSLCAEVASREAEVSILQGRLLVAKRDRDAVSLLQRVFTDRWRQTDLVVKQTAGEVLCATERLTDARVRLGYATTELNLLEGELPQQREQLDALQERVRELEASLTQEAGSVADVSLEAIRSEWLRVQQERDTLLERIKAVHISLDNKRLIALTLDTFVSRSTEAGLNCDWVVVDEAGYAHLVKVLPLLSLSCPMTLLGDHHQLGPVCETDDADQEIVEFWGRSALALEDVWRSSAARRATRCANEVGDDPVLAASQLAFKKMRVLPLTESFRFSDTLAALLDQHVYGIGLRGVSDAPTTIRVIEVTPQASPDGTKRVNVGEVNATLDLVQSLPRDSVTSLAVLSPYKNQVRALQDAFSRARLNTVDVLNVHRAQGREWDIVVLSTVDGSLPGCSPWFTTCRKSHGITVLNTAISRVRRSLFVVCDCRYWRLLEHELLTNLLLLGVPYTPTAPRGRLTNRWS